MAARFRYDYLLAAQPRWPGQATENHDAYRVDFYVHQIYEIDKGGVISDEMEDEPVLQGQVDWQDGIHLWQAEHIDPSEFVAIMATAHAAIWQARTLIGANWIHGESGAEYDPADAPTA